MSTTESQEWDESDYLAALARLETLTDKITSLRTTIPSLISPLTTRTTQPATKRNVFMALKKSAVQATTEVKETREMWESEETKKLFERARRRVEEDGDLSAGSKVEVWGWSEEGKKEDPTEHKRL